MRSIASQLAATTFLLLCACASLPQQSVATGGDASLVEKLREEQFQLLAQVRYELALLEPIVNASRGSDERTVKFRERYDALRREFRRIEDDVQKNESGSTVYVSAGAKDPRIAEYYERLRVRIEEAGTSSFPRVAGKSIYGAAAVLVSMRPTGEVTAVEVAESSSDEIRRHVQALMQRLSPLEPLPRTVDPGASRVLLVAAFNYTATK
jgi:protein TonB